MAGDREMDGSSASCGGVDRLDALERDACAGGVPGLLAQVLEQVPAAAFVARADGAVVYANGAFVSRHGADAARSMAPGDFLEAGPGGGPSVLDEIAAGRPWSGLLRAGREAPAAVACLPLRALDARPTHFLCLEESPAARRRSGRDESLLSILLRIANAVHTSRDLPDLYRSVHDVLRECIDASNFFIALVDEKEDRLDFVYYADEVDTEYYRIEHISDQETRCLTLDVIRSGRPLLVRKPDLAVSGEDAPPGGRLVVGTAPEVWLGVPLRVGEKIIGAMAVQDYADPNGYCQADVDLLAAVSGQVAMALERKAMEDRLRVSEARYRTVSDSAFNMETWRDADGKMLYVSPSCERITGYPPEAFMQDPDFLERIIHRDDLPLWRRHLACDDGGEGRVTELRFFTPNGLMHWLSLSSRAVLADDGASLGVRCSMRNITERKAMQQELRYTNLHDALTGLANRNLCLDRIRQTMERAKRRDDVQFAVAFMDIDRFRVINDSMGHAVGDELLKEVSYRLLKCVRSLDTVSRFGGDEFVVVLDEMESQREAVRAAKRVRAAMREPFSISGREIRLSMSIGIVLSPVGDMEPEAVLRNANIAMHQAIAAGGNRIKVFNARMFERARRVLDMEHDIRRALERGEFFVHYQPIVDVGRNRAVGFEALVRWNHPDKGVLGPGYFVPFAEESGLIVELGIMVLREACATMAAWLKEHPDRPDMFMSVNLSCRQFCQPNLVEQVTGVLHETGTPAHNLKLEITESAIMDDAEAALSMLRRLKEKGVRLSIDDFGTGYSSLAYLQKFPVDTLKVDRSFISGLEDSRENVAIVRAVLVLARTMGLEVVAEGVEEQGQLDLLRGLECEYVQGFYYSRPLAPDKAGRFIEDASPRIPGDD